MTRMKTLTALAVMASALACSAALFAGPAKAEDKQLTIAMITHAQPGLLGAAALALSAAGISPLRCLGEGAGNEGRAD